MRHAPNSANVIAKLLSVEGFTDFVANGIEQYWRKRSGLTERQKKQIERLDKEIARIMVSAPEGDRQIIGRFIGLHKKMSFDTGLRIGLMTLVFRLSQEMDAGAPTLRFHEDSVEIACCLFNKGLLSGTTIDEAADEIEAFLRALDSSAPQKKEDVK